MTDSPPESPGPRGVVFVMTVAHRPGIVHAIAAVFAHRGLSMQALVADPEHQPSRILVRFRGSDRQCEMVSSVLTRLHDVHELRMLDEQAPEVRMVALCRTCAALPQMPASVQVQTSAVGTLLSGSCAEVERVLAQLMDDGVIEQVSRSLHVL